jgi:hypothetical protein
VLQILPRWKVTYHFKQGPPVAVFVHVQTMAGALNQVAAISFEHEPIAVDVRLAPNTAQQIVGTSTYTTATGV